LVPKNAQKPPNFKRLLVPKRAHLHWAQDQGGSQGHQGDPMVGLMSLFMIHRAYVPVYK